MNKYIQREIEMRCLNCGRSLHDDIMSRKIRIHLCQICRLKFIKEVFRR